MAENVERKDDNMNDRMRALKVKHLANMQSSKMKEDKMKSRRTLKGNRGDKDLNGCYFCTCLSFRCEA